MAEQAFVCRATKKLRIWVASLVRQATTWSPTAPFADRVRKAPQCPTPSPTDVSRASPADLDSPARTAFPASPTASFQATRLLISQK